MPVIRLIILRWIVRLSTPSRLDRDALFANLFVFVATVTDTHYLFSRQK